MVTFEQVRETFDYHADGYLTWRVINPNARRTKPGDIVGNYDPGAQGQRVNWAGSHHLVHRLIYLWHHGRLPDTVDHIDRDRSNNRIENLREATRSMNRVNSTSTWSRTGYRGVSRRGGKFVARLYKNGETVLSKSFDTAEEASEAYEKARKIFHPDVFNT